MRHSAVPRETTKRKSAAREKAAPKRRRRLKLPRWSRPELRERELAQEALGRRLSALLGTDTGVKLNRNRRLLLQLQRDRAGRPLLRMHLAMKDASDAELGVLAAWVRGAPGSAGAVRALVERRQAEIDRTTALRLPEGRQLVVRNRPPRAHDIVGILHELQARHFPGLRDVMIAWSGRPGRGRLMRLGWYDPSRRLISIHERLDSELVPRHFVACIVHHELCHAALENPSRTPTGRRRVHGPEFRALERRFPDLERALAWEREHLAEALRPRRKRA